MGDTKPNTALGDSHWISCCWSPRNLDLVKKSNAKNEPTKSFHSDNGYNRNFRTLTFHTTSMESNIIWTHILNSVEVNNYFYYDRSKHSGFRSLFLWVALSLRIIYGLNYTSSKDP